MRLVVLPGEFAVARLDPDSAVPAWATRGDVHCVVRTPDELSVLCPARDVPPTARAERGWRALKVRGPIPFTEVGVLASMAGPLAGAGVAIFVVSTFDTDYVLVPAARLKDAVDALAAAGHVVDDGRDSG